MVSDLIDRQAAILIASGYCHPANVAKELAKLPSAQPEPCEDTISRKAAIDAIEFGITYAKAINKETGEVKELFRASNDELRKAADRIKQLPSAQLETITCNQCVHYQQNHHYCELLDAEFSPNDYCSYAERREE